jgi:hypothetical protein
MIVEVPAYNPSAPIVDGKNSTVVELPGSYSSLQIMHNSGAVKLYVFFGKMPAPGQETHGLILAPNATDNDLGQPLTIDRARHPSGPVYVTAASAGQLRVEFI